MATHIPREIERPPDDSATSFVERIGERIGAYARVANVFGEPVERNGVTVIPVARARWGFGGGGGREGKPKHAEEASAPAGSSPPRMGGGGGGGAVISPIGYIELTDGGSRFCPIREISAYVPLVLAGGAVLIWLTRRVGSGSRS
jgi:uncharacterized spore protein YtfJ